MPPRKYSAKERAEKAKYFKAGTAYHKDPASMPARYCRCLMHGAKGQPTWCLKEKAWNQTRQGKKCYNPYAFCTKSVGRKGTVECSAHFAYKNVPKAEAAAYKLLMQRKPGAKKRRPAAKRLARSKCAGVSRQLRPTQRMCEKMPGCTYVKGKRASYCRTGVGGRVTLRRGPRGGLFYLTKSGRKRYVVTK